MENIIITEKNKKDLMIFIKKMDQDYKMIDSKLIELLNQRNIRKEMSKELFKIFEQYKESLTKQFLERNDTIKNVLKLLKE